MSFDFSPSFMTISPEERLQRAFTRSSPMEDALAANIGSGFMQSFGIGTFARTAMAPPLESDDPVARRFETPDKRLARLQSFKDKALSEDEYKALPSYREKIPWEKGMTADRSAVLAKWYDDQQAAAFLAGGNPVAGFVGQFLGGLVDPINYIPVFGEGAQTFAIAKAGSIFGRMGLSASEAAINTAAFGILTSDIRSKYGDDVSMAGIADQIGMSALIGGAFGIGVGLLMRGRDVRIKDAISSAKAGMSDIRARTKSQDLLRKAADGIITKGVPDLGPQGEKTIGEIATDFNARTSSTRALKEETKGVAGDKIGEVVMTPDGDRVNVRLKVVEASSLKLAEGELQVRDINRQDSARRVENMAANWDTLQARPGLSSDRGAPIVGDDGGVDSGNHRVMALRRIYEAYPDKAAEVRADLEAQGYDISGFKEPILVAERTTPLSPEARAAFNASSNARTSASMSPVEIANMDAMAMDDEVLKLAAPGPITGADNRSFVASFIGRLPSAERAQLVDAQGNLNRAGVDRIQNALVSIAYGGSDPLVMKRFAEATDDNSRSILGAMADNAAQWSRIQRMIRNGDISPDFDMSPTLTEAVRRLNDWRAQAATEKRPVSTVIKEGLGQLDLMDGAVGLPVRRMIEAFYADDSFTRALGRDAISAHLTAIANEIESLGQPQLFGRPGVTLDEVIEHANGTNAADYRIPASALGFAPQSSIGDGFLPAGASGKEGGSGPQSPQAEADAAARALDESYVDGTDTTPRPVSSLIAPPVTDERFVGGLSIQQSLETQGRNVIPTDGDMAQLEARLETAAQWGGSDASVKMLSTEGRYGGIERSVDIEVRGPNYHPDQLWRSMVREADRANQDSVFLAREVPGDEIDPLQHRPGVELQFKSPVGRNALDEELAKLSEAGVNDFTVVVSGKPTRPGAMPDASGVRILYMPEFERRWGFAAEDLAPLDEKALHDHMVAKADALDKLVANVSKRTDVTGKVSWFETDVAFRGEYKERLNGKDVATGGPEAAGGQAGAVAWRGQSVREGLAGADRQLQWAEERSRAGGQDHLEDPVETRQRQLQQEQQSFAGMKAKTADQSSLHEFLTMEDDMIMADGVVDADAPTRLEIFRKTGWFRGVDGNPRFEISDRDARVITQSGVGYEKAKYDYLVSQYGQTKSAAQREAMTFYGFGRNFVTLGQVLDHAKLYAAYPQARDIPIRMAIDPSGLEYNGYWDGSMINLQAKDIATAKSVILHEVQHVIQQYENHANGGNQHMGEIYEGKGVEKLQKQIAALEAKLKSAREKFATPQDRMEAVRSGKTANLVGMSQDLDLLKRRLSSEAAFEYYQRITGEVEARNVQERARLEAKLPKPAKALGDLFDGPHVESMLPPPWETADRPEGQQIIVANGFGASMIEAGPHEGQTAAGEDVPATRVMREQEAADLLRMADIGDIEGIKNSPHLADVTAAMYAIPETHKVAGFGDIEWAGNRTYIGPDGKPLHSVLGAYDYLIENARTLAAHELGIEPYEVAKERKAVIVIGPPAAGKSTIANRIALKMKAAIPDADEAKKIIPEYANGLGANATHEESSSLADHVLQELAGEGDNLVIPKVGGKASSIEKLTKNLQALGYTVDVILMDVPPVEAFRRMIGRYVKTGRLIPPAYFDEIAPAPARVYEELKANGKQDGYGKVTSDRGSPAILQEADLRAVDLDLGQPIYAGEQAPKGPSAGGLAPRPVAETAPSVDPQGTLDLRLPENEVKLLGPVADPAPEGLADAEASVGVPEDTKALAEALGIDPASGRFDELDEIKQLKDEGHLTEEDDAALKGAARDYENAGAYGRAMKAALACIL